jgi:hypothetical protein
MVATSFDLDAMAAASAEFNQRNIAAVASNGLLPEMDFEIKFEFLSILVSNSLLGSVSNSMGLSFAALVGRVAGEFLIMQRNLACWHAPSFLIDNILNFS